MKVKMNLITILALLGATVIIIGVLSDEDTIILEGMILSSTALIMGHLEDINSKLGE